ncbi:hypothetical protein RCL_jg19414.t1 [Rhizophagus clarus]|uniref:Uncharacterized protein n=1 Tax=Rhizophagus clarus TaxID=94130 RepID=A0A8H3LU92_9GLOM|nr:hypothetical protein RCL_jg19414.t1 [Rhizophagus clarus]
MKFVRFLIEIRSSIVTINNCSDVNKFLGKFIGTSISAPPWNHKRIYILHAHIGGLDTKSIVVTRELNYSTKLKNKTLKEL